jgi:hypothetical protein
MDAFRVGAYGTCAHGAKTYILKLYMFWWVVCFEYWVAWALKLVLGYSLKLDMF